MPVDLNKFTKHLYEAADKKTYGHRRCGEYVRKALQAGGAQFHGSYPGTGKEFGPTLEMLGFHQITVDDPDHFNFIRGDVMVMEPHRGSTAGHVAGTMENTGFPISFRGNFGPVQTTAGRNPTMPSIATKRAIVAALFTLASSVAMAGNKPPRYVNEPVLGLRLDAGVKLDPLPDEVRAKCSRIADDDESSVHLWIFAEASDAGAVYYVASGYLKMNHPALASHYMIRSCPAAFMS